MKKLHAETAADLTPAALALELASLYSNKPEQKDEYVDAANKLASVEDLDSETLQRRVRSLAKRTKLLSAAEYIATHQHEPDLDASIPATLCNEAVQMGARLNVGILSLADFPSPTVDSSRPGIIPTGLSSELDRRLCGGIGSGELCVLLGCTGRGKTSLLIKQGAVAALEGKHVFHVTLEVNAGKTARRYQQALTGMSYHQMIGHPGAVEKAQNKILEAGGNIEIRDWSYEGVTMDDIYALILQYRSLGNPVDVVIIDHLQLVRPVGGAGKFDPRHGYARVAQDARAVAVALGVPLLTAWQANRAALEKQLLTEVDIAESFDVATVADIIISINQTKDEAQNDMMRLHIVKQRESTARSTVPIEADLDRLMIRDIPIVYPEKAGASETIGQTN